MVFLCLLTGRWCLLCLNSPVVVDKASIQDDLRPQSEEDASVKRRPEFAAHFTLQSAVNDPRPKVRGDLNAPVRKQSVLIAHEDASLVVELHFDQLQLIPLRLHQGETVQGLPLFS